MNRSARGAAIHVAEDIVPIAEFKSHLSELVRDLPIRKRPVIITQNGRPAAVILSPAEFDRLSYNARFVEAVSEGLEDIEGGRVLSRDELTKIVDERYGRLPKAKTKRR
jgi:prevent-host-death family protein